MNIASRYILKELLKVFIFALLALFFLYSMIDYSMHMQMHVENSGLTWTKMALYYLLQFSKRIDLLLPLSLLIATLRILYSMNIHHELLAFSASGLSLKKLIRPILFVSGLCTMVNILNFEFLHPKALAYTDYFEKTYRAYSMRDPTRNKGITTLLLNDGTKLVSQRTDGILHDAYWIISSDEFFHMNTLNPPHAKFVDHFKRSNHGVMELVESHENYTFNTLNLKNAVPPKEVTPHENKSITALADNLKNRKDRPQTKTYLLFKLVMPFLSPLLVIALAPIATRFSRHHSIFATFGISLFSLIALFTLMDACVIIGSAHLISPYIAILTVPVLVSAIFIHRYRRWC